MEYHGRAKKEERMFLNSKVTQSLHIFNPEAPY